MAALHAPERWSDARAHLLPVLRRVTEPAHAWYAALADRSNEMVRRQVTPFLHELVVLDLPSARMFVNRAHLELWDAGADAAFAAAHANLAGRAEVGLQQRPEYGGLWQVSSDDRYETSRVLLQGFLAAFGEHVHGTPVAVLPAGRVLLVGGSDNPDQVATLLELAERAFRAAESPLSPILYAPGPGGRLTWWDPPLDHPLRDRILAMQQLMRTHEYEAQREQLAEARTIRSHVAEVQLVHPTGAPSFTLARWEQGRGETLLPLVDRVVLVDDDGETEVPWSAVWSEARGCLEATRLVPERFRARWPIDATLARIKAQPC